MSRVLIRPILKLAIYEIYKVRKLNIPHLHILKYKCFVLNKGKDNLEKFGVKVDEDLFLGYSSHSKTF